MRAGPLSHCKLCELEDFRDPDLRALIRDVCIGNGGARGGGQGEEADREDANGPGFPEGEEHRKSWELAMTARSFRDLGVLKGDAEVLGVGAGREPTIYWLTR